MVLAAVPMRCPSCAPRRCVRRAAAAAPELSDEEEEEEEEEVGVAEEAVVGASIGVCSAPA
jgi:hypothetical protein